MFTCSIIVRFFIVHFFSRLFVSFSSSSYYVCNSLRCDAKHLITCSLPAFEYLGAVILFLFCSLRFRIVLFGFVLLSLLISCIRFVIIRTSSVGCSSFAIAIATVVNQPRFFGHFIQVIHE